MKQKKTKGGFPAKRGKQALDRRNDLDAIDETAVAGTELDNDSLILYFLKSWPWDRGTDERNTVPKSKASASTSGRSKRRNKHGRSNYKDGTSPHTRVKRKPSGASANKEQKAGSDEISSKKPKISFMDMIRQAMKPRGSKKRGRGKVKSGGLHNISVISANTNAAAAESSTRAGKSDSSGIGSMSRSGHLSNSEETYLDSLESDEDAERTGGERQSPLTNTNTNDNSALADSEDLLLDEDGHSMMEDRCADMTTCSYSFSLGDDDCDDNSSLQSDEVGISMPEVVEVVTYEDCNNSWNQTPNLLLLPSFEGSEGNNVNENILPDRESNVTVPDEVVEVVVYEDCSNNVDQAQPLLHLPTLENENIGLVEEDNFIDNNVIELCGLERYTVESTAVVNVENVDNEQLAIVNDNLMSTPKEVYSTNQENEEKEKLNNACAIQDVDSPESVIVEVDDIVELCGLERYTVKCSVYDTPLEIYSNSEVKSSLNLIYDQDEDDSSNDADDNCWQQTEETESQPTVLRVEEEKTVELDGEQHSLKATECIQEIVEQNNDDILKPVEVKLQSESEVEFLKCADMDKLAPTEEVDKSQAAAVIADEDKLDCELGEVHEESNLNAEHDVDKDDNLNIECEDGEEKKKEGGEGEDLIGQPSESQFDQPDNANTSCSGDTADNEESTVEEANPARNMCVNQASTVNTNTSNASVIDTNMNVISPHDIDLPSSSGDQATSSSPLPVTTHSRQLLISLTPVASGGADQSLSCEATEQDNNTAGTASDCQPPAIDRSIDSAGVGSVCDPAVGLALATVDDHDKVGQGLEREEDGTTVCRDGHNVRESGEEIKPSRSTRLPLVVFAGSVEQDIPRQITLLGHASTGLGAEAALFSGVTSPNELRLAAGFDQPCAYPPATLATPVTSTACPVTDNRWDSGVETGTVPATAGDNQDLGNELKSSLSDTSSASDSIGAGLEVLNIVDLCSQPRRPDHSQEASHQSQCSLSHGLNSADCKPGHQKDNHTTTISSSEQLSSAAYFAEEWVDQLEIYFPLTSNYRDKERERKGYVAALEVEERENIEPGQVTEGTLSRESGVLCGAEEEEVGKDKGSLVPLETPAGGAHCVDAEREREVEVGRTLPSSNQQQQQAVLNELLEYPSDDDRPIDSVAMDTVSQGVFFSSVLMPAMDTRLQGLAAGQVCDSKK